MSRRKFSIEECWRHGMIKSREVVFNKFNFDEILEEIYEEAEKQYKHSEINSDILLDILESFGYSEDQKYILREMILAKEEKATLEHTPPVTTDAIPISWILQWQDEKTDGEFSFELITELLEDWEEFKGEKR